MKKIINSILMLLIILASSNAFAEIDDFIKFDHWRDKNEFGFRIGKPVLSHEIGSTPTKYITNTKYNKKKSYDYRFNGFNHGASEIKIKSKFNYRKYENNLFGGTYRTYNQTWDVWSAIKLGVSNKQFTYKPRLIRTESGFAGGAFGWLIEVFDLEYQILGYIINQKNPGKFTDSVITVAGGLASLGVSATQIRNQNNCVEKLRTQGILFPKKIKFDNKGVWLIFGYKQPDLNTIIKLVNEKSCAV